jgi:NADH dehydrogenase
MGHVSAIDLARRAITCATLNGEAILPYDELLLAFGNLARTDFIPGLAERALPLKTVGDAMEIRNVVLRRLARIELETDRALRAAIGHFVVIGGGFSGVEVAGELVDCLKSVRRYYPRVGSDELQVTLVQSLDALLPELPPKLGAAALASLRRRGVEVRLGATAARVNDEGVELKDETCLATRSVITTAGVRPNPLAEQSGLPLERGRIVVNPDMSVPGAPGVWALGDCARVENALEASVCPPTAQFAVRQGRRLADNRSRRRGPPHAVVPISGARHDGDGGPPQWRPSGFRALIFRAACVAAVARLLPQPNADPRPQVAHFRRMELGHVLQRRHHAFPLHEELGETLSVGATLKSTA